MIGRSILVIAAATAIVACGERNGFDATPKSEAPAPRAPRLGDPATTDAMDAVPFAERAAFGRALACEARRHARRTLRPLIVTPDVVRQVAERVRRDPRVAECPPPATSTPTSENGRPGAPANTGKRAD